MITHKLKQYFQNNLWYGSQVHGAFEAHFGALSILVQPDLRRVWGTDISHWDGNVSLGVTQSLGARFVFIKAIDGTLQARYFVENRQRAKDSGLIDGAYGWLYRNVNVSCVAQAQAFDALTQKYPVSLPEVIDFEPTRWAGQASNPTYTDLRTWLTEWLRLGNRKPILYSAAYYMNQFGQIPSDMKDMIAGLWIAHYGTVNPAMPLGYGAGEWLFHQFTSSGDAHIYSPNDANKLEVDMNYAVSEQKMYELAGQVQPIEPDAKTMPFLGVEYITGMRYGRKFYLAICDPARVRFEVAHAPGSPDLLDYPSNVALRKGAQLGWNGGEWDKYHTPYMPKDYSVSNGSIYKARLDFVPSLLVFQDGHADIQHTYQAGVQQATSGLRYLLENGQIKSYLYGTDLQYTDRTARTVEGVTADGRVMVLVVDGENPGTGVRYGVKLSEAAAIMLEFGAVKAFDSGGGGDSTININGVRQNVPEDIDNGVNVERRVPEFLLAYAQEDQTMAKNKVTITWDGGARERQKPRVNTLDTYGTVLLDNSVHYSDVDVVPDMDDPNNPDKKWIQLQSGWYIATRYPSSSGIFERAKVEPIVPTVPSILVSHIFDDTLVVDGKEYTAHFEVPNVEYKPKA